MKIKKGAKKKATVASTLLRVKQGESILCDLDKNILIAPDGMDSVLDQIEDWAALSSVWGAVTESQRDTQRNNSVFPPLIAAARSELTRIASGLKRIQNDLREKSDELTVSRKQQELEERISRILKAVNSEDRSGTKAALHAIANGTGYPDYLWARIILTAIDAKNNPASLNAICIAILRGDLLWAIAEKNHSMVKAMQPFAKHELSVIKKQANNSKKGGLAKAVTNVVEDTWKSIAIKALKDYPKWKKSDVARYVGKQTNGNFHTIRKRTWFIDLFKKND
jgi:hypothetical protein